MKKLFPVLLVMFIGVAAFLTSCEEETPTADPLPTATIEGVVYANIDLTNAVNEKAPAGTKIFFRINANELVLNPLPGYTYETLQYETTVNSEGKYTIELPCATHQNVNVAVTPNDFSAVRQINATTTDTHYFDGGVLNQTIRNGEKHYLDIMYF
ncbi:MAG TPA: hypothetical protein PLP11_03840 [Bacteroidales bacterium]|nr:hypothetical protein [Bacteroidales bacterium]